MKKEQDNYGITINHLLYYLTCKGQYSAFDRDCFLDGLKRLIANNIISVELSFGLQDRIINLSTLHINKDEKKLFVAIDIKEIQVILNSCKTNKYSILRYFILLIGTFNPKIEVEAISGLRASNVLGNMPISYLSTITGLSDKTIMEYNKQLEELQLIYIYHAKDFYRTSDNTIKSPSNVYGRYYDKAFVDQFVKIQAHNKKYEVYGKEEKLVANHKRRLSQRYNRIVSGFGDYSIDEIKEVYDYIVAQNKECQAQYENSKWESFKDKIRDVSILENILQVLSTPKKQ